jgi:hypothetical protein
MSRSGASADPRRTTIAAWTLAVAAVGGLVVALSTGRHATDVVGSSSARGWIAASAGALALVGADRLLAAAREQQHTEEGILGAALWVFAVLWAAHGFDAAGVISAANPGSALAALLAPPAALAAAGPLLAPGSWPARAVARHWRAWAVAWIAVATAVALALFTMPDRSPHVPAAGACRAVGLVAAAGWTVLSARYLRRHLRSFDAAMLGVSVSTAALAMAGLAWWSGALQTVGWSTAAACATAGMLALAPFAGRALGIDPDRRALLAPLARRDALAVPDIAESPLLRWFVRVAPGRGVSLVHAARVEDLALRCGDRVGLRARRMRALACAAAVHDLASALPPPDPAATSGPDDAEERARDMLARQHALAPAARLVRSRRERVDGTGRPDGIADTAIPVEARVLAVCDTYEVVVERNSRAAARRRVRDGVGTAFDASVVDALERVLDDLDADGPAPITPAELVAP